MMPAMNYSPFREIAARFFKRFEVELRGLQGVRHEVISEEMRISAEMKKFVSAVTEGMSFNELKELSRGFDRVCISCLDRGADFQRNAIAARHEILLERQSFSVKIGLGDTFEEAVADAVRKLKDRYGSG